VASSLLSVGSILLKAVTHLLHILGPRLQGIVPAWRPLQYGWCLATRTARSPSVFPPSGFLTRRPSCTFVPDPLLMLRAVRHCRPACPSTAFFCVELGLPLPRLPTCSRFLACFAFRLCEAPASPSLRSTAGRSAGSPSKV
jgi:hypothetical protein